MYNIKVFTIFDEEGKDWGFKDYFIPFGEIKEFLLTAKEKGIKRFMDVDQEEYAKIIKTNGLGCKEGDSIMIYAEIKVPVIIATAWSV